MGQKKLRNFLRGMGFVGGVRCGGLVEVLHDAHGENFSPILKQSAEHVGGEEGRGRVEGFADGVANPAGFADGLNEDGKGDAADKVSFWRTSFCARHCRILTGAALANKSACTTRAQCCHCL